MGLVVVQIGSASCRIFEASLEITYFSVGSTLTLGICFALKRSEQSLYSLLFLNPKLFLNLPFFEEYVLRYIIQLRLVRSIALCCSNFNIYLPQPSKPTDNTQYLIILAVQNLSRTKQKDLCLVRTFYPWQYNFAKTFRDVTRKSIYISCEHANMNWEYVTKNPWLYRRWIVFEEQDQR